MDSLYALAALVPRKNLPVPTEEETVLECRAGLDSLLKKTMYCPCQEWLPVVQSVQSLYELRTD